MAAGEPLLTASAVEVPASDNPVRSTEPGEGLVGPELEQFILRVIVPLLLMRMDAMRNVGDPFEEETQSSTQMEAVQ